MGKPPGSNFTKIPNGIPSLEHRVSLVYTHGVAAGRIDLNTFVDCASTQAAKLFGLFPRKGTIQIGSDADLVVFDPNYRGKLTAKSQYMNVDYGAFEAKVKGRASVVTVRGKVQGEGWKVRWRGGSRAAAEARVDTGTESAARLSGLRRHGRYFFCVPHRVVMRIA